MIRQDYLVTQATLKIEMGDFPSEGLHLAGNNLKRRKINFTEYILEDQGRKLLLIQLI